MRKIFILLLMSVLSLGMYGQTDQVTVTWETENTGLTVIGPVSSF